MWPLATATIFCVAFLTVTVLSEVQVTDSTEKEIFAEIKSVPASFGRPLPEDGIHGRAVMAVPKHGCSAIAPPPDDQPFSPDILLPRYPLPFGVYDGDELFAPPKLGWIILVSRYGNCTFEEKVRNAEKANYSAVIVYNVNSDKVIPMGGDDSNLIPSVFIGASDADLISKRFTFKVNPAAHVIMTDDEPFDINSYLLPFAIVVGICFLIMLGIVIFKCIQDHRRNRRHRLPKSALKKLPIHKFKPGDPFETCCICLDDFEDGDKLRVLPCDHGYHSKCIDPWLVKNKRICPQCRKKVFASNERGARLLSGSTASDSDSDQPTNERAPLLRPQAERPGGSGGYGGMATTSTSAVLTETVVESLRRQRRRRPFFSRIGDRARRNDVIAPSAEDSSSGSSSTSDGEGDEVTTQGGALMSDRHVASAEVHVHSQVQDEQDKEDDAIGPVEVIVVVEDGSSINGDSSQINTGAEVENV